MAQEQIPLFNFYFRYKWNENDFAQWQEGMVNLQRAAMEGTFNGAAMAGFDLVAASAMEVGVSGGLAIAPSGYLMVENDDNVIEFTAPTTNPRKDLIVIRPKIVEDEVITRPTSPFDNVFLKQLQDCEVVVIEGTESATPEYPAKETVNDIILGGVRLYPGMTGIMDVDLDFEVKEIYGKNSNFQQNAAKYDDRLRPYRQSEKLLGVKPSQLANPHARAFSFINQAQPSIFPKAISGDYNHADTFLNFETGEITGGDESSADFTEQIPTAGNWIVATVAINTSDEIQVSYGVEGTREQCVLGVINQRTAGAGSVQRPTNAKFVAFVLVKSSNGTLITELEFFDVRGLAAVVEGTGGGGLAGGGTTEIVLPYNITNDDDGKVLRVDTTAASGVINLPVAQQELKFTVKDIGGVFGTNKVQIVRDSTEEIEFLSADYDLESNYGQWNFYCDGTDWFII